MWTGKACWAVELPRWNGNEGEYHDLEHESANDRGLTRKYESEDTTRSRECRRSRQMIGMDVCCERFQTLSLPARHTLLYSNVSRTQSIFDVKAEITCHTPPLLVRQIECSR